MLKPTVTPSLRSGWRVSKHNQWRIHDALCGSKFLKSSRSCLLPCSVASSVEKDHRCRAMWLMLLQSKPGSCGNLDVQGFRACINFTYRRLYRFDVINPVEEADGAGWVAGRTADTMSQELYT